MMETSQRARLCEGEEGMIGLRRGDVGGVVVGGVTSPAELDGCLFGSELERRKAASRRLRASIIAPSDSIMSCKLLRVAIAVESRASSSNQPT